MIGRRLLLAGAVTLPFRNADAALPITETFQRRGDALIVSVVVDIEIGLGPIAFFRYRNRATVHWEGGQVVSVDAATNDDGSPQHMSARRDESGLVVEGSKAPRYTAPPRSLPGTHWNRAMLDAPFINTEDGRLMHPTVTMVGEENVAVTGGTVEAQHFTLRGDADLDNFYDLTPSWVGLRFTAKDGSDIRYLRA
jgi:hypothetical protein